MSNYICEELISEIFERLPAKSLIRFRSLSKSWYSHIASSDFIRRHKLRHANKAPKVLIRHVTYGDKVIQDHIINQDIGHRCLCHLACTRFLLKTGGCVAIQELNDDIYTLHSEDELLMYPECVNMSVPAVKFPVGKGNIAGSCNGIICLLNNGNVISLWNPSIRRILTLPDNPFVRTSFETFVAVGFGFDPISDSYKIVKIATEKLPCSTRHKHNFFVYSMKTETWCAIDSPSTPFHNVVSRACFVNGILHWLVSCSRFDIGIPSYILTFDLSTHVFGMISLPDQLYGSIQLTVINSSLAVVSSAYDDTYGTWVMKEYNNFNSWSLFSELKGPKFKAGVKNALQLMTNGHLLLNINGDLFKFMVYNPETGVCSMDVHFQDSRDIDVQTYVESLHLLDVKLNCHGQEKRSSRKRKILATIHTDIQIPARYSMYSNAEKKLPENVDLVS